MNVKELKKELDLTNADIAEFFGLGERAYYYSSARQRYEESFIRIYEFLKRKGKKKNKYGLIALLLIKLADVSSYCTTTSVYTQLIRIFMKKIIAKNVKAFREKKGLTQIEVAEKIKVVPVTYGRKERGEFEFSGIELYELSKVLGVELKSLFRGLPTKGSICVSCDEIKETHSLCGDCLSKFVDDNKHSQLINFGVHLTGHSEDEIEVLYSEWGG